MKKILAVLFVFVVVLTACSSSTVSFEDARTTFNENVEGREKDFTYNADVLGVTLKVEFNAEDETLAFEVPYGDETISYTINSNDEVLEGDSDLVSSLPSYEEFLGSLVSDVDNVLDNVDVDEFSLEDSNYVATGIEIEGDISNGVYDITLSSDSSLFEVSSESDAGTNGFSIEFK